VAADATAHRLLQLALQLVVGRRARRAHDHRAHDRAAVRIGLGDRGGAAGAVAGEEAVVLPAGLPRVEGVDVAGREL